MVIQPGAGAPFLAFFARSGALRRHPTSLQPALRRSLLPPTHECWREPGLSRAISQKPPLHTESARNGAPKRHSRNKGLTGPAIRVDPTVTAVGTHRPKNTFWSDSTYVL